MARSPMVNQALRYCGPDETARNPLEVLAGAISWGFKSPSPHQITGCFINKIEQPFSFVPKLCPKRLGREPLTG